MKTNPNWWILETKLILKELGTNTVVNYSKLNSIRSIFSFISEWIMIAAAIFLVSFLNHPLAYFFAVFFIGARMHALAVIMHEGVHFTLFKKKSINDFASQVFCAWPVFMDMFAYRYSHLSHHKNLNTSKDPDLILFAVIGEYKFPKTKKELRTLFFRDLLGITVITQIYKFVQIKYLKLKNGQGLDLFKNPFESPSSYIWGKYIFYAFIIPLTIYLIGWKLFLLCWILPYATWRPFIFRIRIISEHYGLGKEILLDTRNVTSNILEQAFLVPRNVNYHLVHHLFPSVPQYNLPRLHRLLMSKSVKYANESHNLNSYFDVLKEVSSLSELSFSEH